MLQADHRGPRRLRRRGGGAEDGQDEAEPAAEVGAVLPQGVRVYHLAYSMSAAA